MNKTVLITGTSSGIGRASVLKFQREGWNVIATMRSPEKETELNRLENVLVVALDVVKLETVESAIQAGLEKFGQIHAVVNNAGSAVLGVFEWTSEEQIKRVFETNVYGPMRVIKAVLPHLREKGEGVIINISSGGGRITFPITSIYHSSKFALEGFTESLAYELIPFGIRTKIVEPGSTATKFVGEAEVTSGNIPKYEEFINVGFSNWAKYDTMTSQPEEIADGIFYTANEENNTLRYKVGEDTLLYVGKLEEGNNQAYVDFMRNRFMPEYL
jgi:NAD(P)-dependent dehydrogenase (short-subunit alcohol dehydrogenase family)